MTTKTILNQGWKIASLALVLASCTPALLMEKTENKAVPESFDRPTDSTSVAMIDSLTTPADSNITAKMNWKDYFKDEYLISLIDTALANNQELNITLQEIQIYNNEIRARQGEYLPFVGLGAGAGVEKPGRYTMNGTSEANLQIEPGKATPDPLPDYMLGLYANWEIDIWNKLHNAKKAAVAEYLASVEGKNFMVTNLIAEIANSYYELLALDNQLAIVEQNIEIQSNALATVKLQKQAARVTELAVRKFEAEVLHTKSLRYDIQQEIVITENRINFLLGRYPQHIERQSEGFGVLEPDSVLHGVPAQLLDNRPDIRQAELKLVASKLNVKVAKANFYPSLSLSGAIGYQAYNPSLLFSTPESMLYGLAGEVAAPLLNRRALTAAYYNANSEQIQAVYEYERAVLKAYLEVMNQMSNMQNLKQSIDLKSKEVQALTESIYISQDLFRSARADYMEVLMTQRDALKSKFELVETKKKQMNAMVNIYKALGGGWQ